MSAHSVQRASDLAALQVEQIVAAAQAAADEIRKEAALERQQSSAAARRECEEAIEAARRSAQAELTKAHKQAILLGQDARREAEAVVGDAEDEAAEIRDRARHAVEGRVAAAERAAAEVLDEARALSGGLRQLGKALEDHADRILRDVTAAHKRMQSDLRVGATPPGERSLRAVAAPSAPSSNGEEPSATKRRNPFEEIEVPSWVGRER